MGDENERVVHIESSSFTLAAKCTQNEHGVTMVFIGRYHFSLGCATKQGWEMCVLVVAFSTMTLM